MSVISKTPVRFQMTPLDGKAHEVDDPVSWLKDSFGIELGNAKVQNCEILTTKIKEKEGEEKVKEPAQVQVKPLPKKENKNIKELVANLRRDLRTLKIDDSYSIDGLNSILKNYDDETKKHLAGELAANIMKIAQNCNIDRENYPVIFYMSLVATIKNEPELLGEAVLEIDTYTAILSEINKNNEMVDLIVDAFNAA